jgi:hypothetical protein
MQIVHVGELGAIGVVEDVPLYDQPPNVFSKLHNLRPWGGNIESVFNYSTQSPFNVISNANSVGYFEKNDIRYWVSGNTTTVYIHNGSSGVNLDTGFSATNTIGWQFIPFQGLLVYNNGVDVPQYWTGASFTNGAGEPLPNWPATSRVRVMRAYKNFLIGLYVTDNNTVYHTRVAWGNPAEPGSVPSTWNPNDDTADSGWFDLADTPGPVLDCAPLGDVNVVYKSDSIWGMVTTTDDRVFRFYKISSSQGALGINCIANVPGGHVVLGNGDVFLNTGQGEPRSLVNRKVREAIFDRININNAPYAFVTVQPRYEEVWICLPSIEPVGGIYPCNLAYTINYRTGAIATRDLPNVMAADFGYPAASATALTYAGATATYNTAGVATYDIQNFVNEESSLLACVSSTVGGLLVMDQFDSTVSRPMAIMERAQVAITGRDYKNQIITDSTVYKTISNIWLKMQVEGEVKVVVGLGDQPFFNSPIRWDTLGYFRERYNSYEQVGDDPADAANPTVAAIRADVLITSLLPAILVTFDFTSSLPSKVKVSGYALAVSPSGISSHV